MAARWWTNHQLFTTTGEAREAAVIKCVGSETRASPIGGEYTLV